MAARSNRDRVLQIARWLAAEFPAPYPVTVRCPKKIAALPGSKGLDVQIGDSGVTRQRGRRITINIAVRPGFSRATVIDSILHEWAHAATVRHADIEMNRGDHDDEWALMYGRIYRRFFDEDGCKDSEDF
jgi:hypothetical protein